MANTITNSVIAGISFPFRTFGSGLPAASKGIDVYRSALTLLLRTKQRSRVMRPDVGMNLHKFIFEEDSSVLRSLITREILSQVSLQLPEISIIDITFSAPRNQNDKKITLNLTYSIQGIVDQTGNVTVAA